MSEKALSPARHEPTDVGARFIWIGVPLLLVSVLALGLLVLWLYPGATVDRTIRLPLAHYPSPQLQSNPRADMQTFYAEEIRTLNSAGWIDKARGVAHIPISDAMRDLTQEGIAGWPAPTEKRP